MLKHPIRDLFWQALRLDESRLPLSCIDTNCLKNVQSKNFFAESSLHSSVNLCYEKTVQVILAKSWKNSLNITY